MAKRRSFDWNAVSEKIKELDKRPNYNNNNEDDENFYKHKTDEHGNANVLMRFLPPHPEEDLPFVKKYNHGFQSVNGWFIEDCPTTIGKECPICKHNSSIWDSDQNTARNQKRKVSFFANILIIKDPNCPENEGKVFKYRYGIKIHEKIMEKIAPESDIDDPVQIFDYDNGANFKLKVKTQKLVLGGKERLVPNYDASSFTEPTPIVINGKPLTDSELEELDSKIYKLQPLVDESIFKSSKELSDIFFKKTGIKISDTGNVKATKDPIKEMKEAAEKDFSKFDDDESDDLNETTSNDSNDLDDLDDADFFAKLREQSE